MSHDDALADRVRALLNGPHVTEKRMFGGLAFLVDGQMAVAANSEGVLMVRVDPDDAGQLLRETGAEPMVMRDRPMTGWLRVAGAELADDTALAAWVQRGVERVAALPPKG